jgi:formylglycine-generating enzyme required for sulfatase activity/dienelactone hydrolase
LADALGRLTAALADRYSIERELGAGGMATVYLAEDLKHHRQVAIKVLKPELAAAVGPERFLREIEIAARLTHPHILPLHDSGEADGFLYYVMPYVEGESLRDWLQRAGTPPIGDTLRLLRDVADALAYAHQHGVVHRDIKLDNVMLAGRHAVVTDFGVAKAVSAADRGSAFTTVGVSVGTPAYMAPEQAAADPNVDHRADLYAFGVLAYELLVGRLPFAAVSAQAVMVAHLTERPQPLLEVREDLPPALAAAVMRCLEKEPDARFQSADELLAGLEGLLTPGGGVTPVGSTLARTIGTPGRRRRVLAAGGVILLAAAAWLVLSVRHGTRVRWAREQAIPQIRQLADSALTEAAYSLALEARRVIPNDSSLGVLWMRITMLANIHTEPSGARVYRRDYLADSAAWEYLGITPVDSFRIPNGLSLLRFEKDGFAPLEVAGWPLDSAFALGDGRAVPAGMVRVPGGLIEVLNISGLEHLAPVSVGTYLMDAYEVTNRQFKEFVDSGGYRRREFWDRPFELDGKPLSWDAAIARFTDRTGRPGPSTWEAGGYPAGQGNYPVSGVSWYEAAAYATYAHKSLPTIYHWGWAATPFLSMWIVPRSNFDGTGPAPVGSHRAGPYGTFDMAGNVREWCLNATGSGRYILGGGWNDPPFAFNYPYAQQPSDRSPTNGIRLARYLPGDTTVAVASRPALVMLRDFSKERPVPDGIFQVYRRLYDYDRTPLHAVVEESDSSAEEFIRQRITFDAAYGNERVTAYLFLPKHGRPPYQTVVYFPGANAIDERSFTSSETGFYDFIVKSGRAVMFPIYKSTYERGDNLHTWHADETNFYKDHVIMWAKDLRRSIDYLQTRSDIDTARLAYYGFSWGGYLGGLMPAVEPRFRTVVLFIAGFVNVRGQPEVEPINFLPRITAPVLMLNGRYDHYFPVESSQRPFFRLLGTPSQHKRLVISEGGHDVPRTQLIAETLTWLDRYLGPVR